MAANQLDNQLRISWHDSAWIPILNAENILDYFCQRTNPFYDRTCNNEVVKMQRLDPAQLKLMTGVEYELIHGQDPILYVIRKQQRHSPTQVTYLAVYYILAGVVYQCPDLGSVLNSRLLSTVQNLELAFDEAVSYSRYTPSKGYWWQFQDSSSENKSANKKPKKAAEPGSLFQRQRVDILLSNFLSKFPPKVLQPTLTTNQPVDTSNLKTEDTSSETPNSKEQSSDSGTVGTASQKPGLNNPVDVKNVTCRVASPVVNTGIQRVSTPDSKPLTPPSKKRKI